MAETDPNQQIVTMAQMEHIFKMFQQMQQKTNTNTTTEITPSDLRITEKLNYQNYITWCKLMQIAIEGRGHLSHITDAPPKPTEPTYQQWKQRDSMVLSSIISNIDTELINLFLDYTVARDLWKRIEVLLSSGHDELQIFDLSSKASSIKQNQESIEVFYGKLTTIWKEIDRRMPNQMIHAEDITIFNSYIQNQRLYQFLAGINDTFDKERRNLLNRDPLHIYTIVYEPINNVLSGTPKNLRLALKVHSFICHHILLIIFQKYVKIKKARKKHAI